ncbi:MAG: GAF domain-containing protein [Clostridiales bacterium]|nr:GAF domain-containing protein [Clostridiales bacterium]
MNIDYKALNSQIESLILDIPHLTANLANASAALNLALDDINWVGFYLMQNGKLILGPFQGKPACIEIEVGKGVCGTAVYEKRSQLVFDVHKFPGHIACDPCSRSEVVIPIFNGNEIAGVLDIDSPKLNNFNENDLLGLEEIVKTLEKHIFKE